MTNILSCIGGIVIGIVFGFLLGISFREGGKE